MFQALRCLFNALAGPARDGIAPRQLPQVPFPALGPPGLLQAASVALLLGMFEAHVARLLDLLAKEGNQQAWDAITEAKRLAQVEEIDAKKLEYHL